MNIESSTISRLNKLSLFRRVIIASMIVHCLALVCLALMDYYQAQTETFTRTSRTIPEQLVYVGEELNLAGVSIGAKIAADNSMYKIGSNKFALCHDEQGTLFISQRAQERGLLNLCDFMQAPTDNIKPVQLDDERFYYLYPLLYNTNNGPYKLVIARDATDAQSELATRAQYLTLKVLLLLPILLLLLVSTALWSIRPLAQLSAQLKEIVLGQRKRLAPASTKELYRITEALNELMEQSDRRKETYQNAMKDLAHSLKTRLAAAQFILDEDKDPTNKRQDLYEQLGQMDALVQYQLRKATIGPQGLQQATTEIEPIVQQLAAMLDKVYRDKSIQCQIQVQKNCLFPGSKEDLLELLGNLMDNAYRFAIKIVAVSVCKHGSEHCLLQIEDDGSGIELSDRERVLRRGERADERHPGQGIGLAVCHQIAKAYGGKLYIDDSALQGARINILLPVTAYNEMA